MLGASIRVYAVFLGIKQMMLSTIYRTACPLCGGAAIQPVFACQDFTVSKKQFEVWGCSDCHVRFTQDAPAANFIGPYYDSPDYISHTDSDQGLLNKIYKLARNYTLEWKLRLVNRTVVASRKPGRVLDIGCGTGAFLHKAQSAGWSVNGLEPDAGARRLCLEKYGIQADAPERLFDLEGSFEAITMWHVLEHVHQLHEYMDQLKRLLQPGGVILIALPNYTSTDAEIYQQYWAAYDVPRHLYHFSPAAMGVLAQLHGLRIEAAKPMWLDAFYISLLSERYKNGKTAPARAFINGLRSNLRAIKSVSRCSSVVYVMRHAD